MKRNRLREEEIIRMLREAEVHLSQGKSVKLVSRELGITEQTYYRWRKEYGGMKVSQERRLKELEQESSTALLIQSRMLHPNVNDLVRGCHQLFPPWILARITWDSVRGAAAIEAGEGLITVTVKSTAGIGSLRVPIPQIRHKVQV